MPWLPLSNNPRPPLRKAVDGVGKLGKPINLRANFFKVTIKNPTLSLVHYDVVIKDGIKGEVRLPKTKKMLIFETMKKIYPRVFTADKPLAFDQEKNAYSVGAIPQLDTKNGVEYEVEVQEESGGKKRKFTVKLEVVNRASLQDVVQLLRNIKDHNREQPITVIQMLEVMFRHNPSLNYVRVGRSSFFPTCGEFSDPCDIGGGKEGIVGFFGSLRPAVWKDGGSLLLNIDVANSAFFKEQMLMDFIWEKLGFRSDSDFDRPMTQLNCKKVLKELANIKIQVTHTPIPRTYKITEFLPLGADRQTFPLKNEQGVESMCTVEKYFMQQYKKKLKYPKFNCLKAGPKDRNIYIPVEFCKIMKGQKVKKKLSDRETAQFIRSTAVFPAVRLRHINKIAQANNFNDDPMMKALQFSISDRPVEITGRVLPPPSIIMDKEMTPRQGVWDSRDRTFFNGATLNVWVVFCYDGYMRDEELKRFLNLLLTIGRERGMKIVEPVITRKSKTSPLRDFHDVKVKYPNLQLIMVILPKGNPDIYPEVKKIGDREIGVITQCVQSSNVGKCAPATVGNILLKINAKMGGVNNILGNASKPIIFTKPVMIMGADVNHPAAGDLCTPSLAAVVASMDKHASKYIVEVRHQKHRVEMIQDLQEMTKNLLRSFLSMTKCKPERIIMYRDGVSESQFLEVLAFELKAMRAACVELNKDYNPGITFLVVQKRHHTRLFCEERDSVGKSKNIPPGTTVDTWITHPDEQDFYLCSHQGIQGTSKPTHYHLLWDDNNLTMDQMQSLTYAMCHLYSRCTRSVSIPTPAYYAHLAAFRAKVHLHDLCSSDGGSIASGDGAIPDDQLTKAVRIENSHAIYNTMYFV